MSLPHLSLAEHVVDGRGGGASEGWMVDVGCEMEGRVRKSGSDGVGARRERKRKKKKKENMEVAPTTSTPRPALAFQTFSHWMEAPCWTTMKHPRALCTIAPGTCRPLDSFTSTRQGTWKTSDGWKWRYFLWRPLATYRKPVGSGSMFHCFHFWLDLPWTADWGRSCLPHLEVTHLSHSWHSTGLPIPLPPHHPLRKKIHAKSTAG